MPAHKKSLVTLSTDILVKILERTSLATLHFSCRLVSKMFRSWSKHFLRKKLEPAYVVTGPYDGKCRQSCALTTAVRVVTGKKPRRFPNSVTNTLDAYIAFEREIRQVACPQTICPSVRLPWQCRIVVFRISAKSGSRTL